MSSVEARKFTDADVRRDSTLLQAAIDYAEDYAGDFEFLVTARDIVEETGSLPVAVARGVLNCMRADPWAQRSLPDLPRPGLPRAAGQPKLRVVRPEPKRELPTSVDIPIRINLPFGVATGGGAHMRVVHRPVSGDIAVGWNGEEWEHHWRWSTKKTLGSWIRWHRTSRGLVPTEPYIVWACGRTTSRAAFFAEEPDLRRCKSGCWEDQ